MTRNMNPISPARARQTASLIAAALLLAPLTGCGGLRSTSPKMVQPETPAEIGKNDPPASTTMPASQNQTLVNLLPELARGHEQKIKLGLYMTSFLRKVDPPVEQFGRTLIVENRELLAMLKKAAANDHLSIKFHYGDSPASEARKREEDAQSHVIQSDDNTDFQRDILMLMYMDHEWELAVSQTIAQTQVPPDIKAYLDREIASRQSRIAEIRALQKHYHWQ